MAVVATRPSFASRRSAALKFTGESADADAVSSHEIIGNIMCGSKYGLTTCTREDMAIPH